MTKTQRLRFFVTPVVIFATIAGLVFTGLLMWRDAQVRDILNNHQPGDVVSVGTDVCNRLRDRGHVAEGVHCGYRQTVRVTLIDPSE